MKMWMRMQVTLAMLALCGSALAQEKPQDIKIITPVADQAAGTVTLPGAFWNEHVADWLDVAFCGRPSDFLHETVISVTTTRTLLEQALRDIGCHDGDAWVDNVQEFPRLRGDHLMVVLAFARDGQQETWPLDELIAFSHWGVPLGPYGFMFKGDPDHAVKAATTGETPLADSAKILRDDPQIALVFRGIQSLSQSFADHPLAYVEDRWPWEEIHRGRNHTALPAAVFDSNGKLPVTVIFKKVTEEQLLTESAKIWHDAAFKAYLLKQLETAKRIDKNKADYLTLRQDPNRAAGTSAKLSLCVAQIERDYATLDAAWSAWAVDHLKPETPDNQEAAAIQSQARRWNEFLALHQERATQLAIAAEPTGPGESQGRSIAARSRALIAENKQSRDYWQDQLDKLGVPQPDDVWAQVVGLHIALEDARLKAGAAGVAYGQSLQAAPHDPAQDAALQKALDAAVRQMTLADARLSLATVEFEISKRQGPGPADPDLPNLNKQRATLQSQIKDLESTPIP